jgi:hypothetical protein
MTDISTIIDDCFAKTKTALDSGNTIPVSITFTSNGRQVVSFSSLLNDKHEIRKFQNKLIAYPKNFPEIDAGYISAVALTQRGDDNDKQDKFNTEKAVIVAFCTRKGESLAFFQPFSVVANEVFYGEKNEVSGTHNFCDYLLMAFDLREKP